LRNIYILIGSAFDMETNVSKDMPSDKEIAKVATGSIIGSIIEQYDFLVTGTIAGLVWGTLFFGPYGGIVGAISTYALGIMVRPIGATIFGQLADRIGRRDSMVYAIILMGISTLIIGLVQWEQVS
jgi:Sugar (and other) transporter.